MGRKVEEIPPGTTYPVNRIPGCTVTVTAEGRSYIKWPSGLMEHISRPVDPATASVMKQAYLMSPMAKKFLKEMKKHERGD